MVESVIPAVVIPIKDLRRRDEELIVFYHDPNDNQIKTKVVGYEIGVRSDICKRSGIYNGMRLEGIAYPVFVENREENKALEGIVAIAKWEKYGERVESKFFITCVEPTYINIFRILSIEIKRSTLLRLYMEQSIAERLGIEEAQRVTLLPLPKYLWHAAKK